jgi:hypothetical protein
MVLVLAGCGSDAVSTKASRGSDAGSSTAATAATGLKSGGPLSAAECTTVKETFASLNVNWQLVTQLRDEPDIKQWADIPIGTLDKMSEQIAALRVLEPFAADAKPSLDFIQGAADIVAKGRGGDSAAPAELKGYLTGDVVTVLMKMTTLGPASDAAGC